MRCSFCGCDIPGGMLEACPKCGEPISIPGPFLKVIGWIEDSVITLMLLSMVMLVLIQIVLRNFYATGITGGAEMVRHLVLWVAFIGAGIAARERKHIKIDIAQRMLPLPLRRLSEVIADLFTVAIGGILLYASIQFVWSDRGSGTIIPFFDLSIPIWTLELVIPIGYAAVTLRYALYCLQSFRKFLKGA